MQCPECQSEHIRKNGKNRQGKQNYICADCHRQFVVKPFNLYGILLANGSVTL